MLLATRIARSPPLLRIAEHHVPVTSAELAAVIKDAERTVRPDRYGSPFLQQALSLGPKPIDDAVDLRTVVDDADHRLSALQHGAVVEVFVPEVITIYQTVADVDTPVPIVVVRLAFELLDRITARQALPTGRQHRIEVRLGSEMTVTIFGEQASVYSDHCLEFIGV